MVDNEQQPGPEHNADSEDAHFVSPNSRGLDSGRRVPGRSQRRQEAAPTVLLIIVEGPSCFTPPKSCHRVLYRDGQCNLRASRLWNMSLAEDPQLEESVICPPRKPGRSRQSKCYVSFAGAHGESRFAMTGLHLLDLGQPDQSCWLVKLPGAVSSWG